MAALKLDIQLEIPGKPVQWARARLGGAKHFTPDPQVRQMETIRMLFKERFPGGVPYEGPLALAVAFYYERPKYHMGTGSNKGQIKEQFQKARKMTTPDLDNLVKLVEDALNEFAYKDDSQIVMLTATKGYSTNARTRIHLTSVDGTDERGEDH